MLQVGGEGEGPPSESPSEPGGAGETARVIGACLAIAALVAVAGVAAQAVALNGSSFGDRLQAGAVDSIYAMGTALATVVALSRRDASATGAEPRARWRVWVYDSLGVAAVAVVIGSVWSIVDTLGQTAKAGGPNLGGHDEIQRFASAALALAPALIALAVIVVIVQARRRSGPDDAADAADLDDGIAGEILADLAGPTLGCLLAAGVVLLAVAVDSAFTEGRVSFGDQVARAALATSDLKIAFIAFTVVVLAALGCRVGTRDREHDPVPTVAGAIGLLTMVAAVYSVWTIATVSAPGNQPPVVFLATNSWARIGGIGSALAAGAVGIAAAYAARRLREDESPEPPEPPPFPDDDELVPEADVSAARNGALVVGALLAASAVSYATFIVLVIVGQTHFAINDLLADASSLVVVPAGLALAAAIVTVSGRSDAIGSGALGDAVDAIVALLSVAVVAVSGYTVIVILFGRHTHGSFLSQIGNAQRLGFVGSAVASAFLGAAALSLIARSWQADFGEDPDDDDDDEVEVVELLS